MNSLCENIEDMKLLILLTSRVEVLIEMILQVHMKFYILSATIFLLIAFTSCNNKGNELKDDTTPLTNDTIGHDNGIDGITVDVELMYRFKNDSLASKLQSRFSDYFSRIANSEEVHSFYDTKTKAVFYRPEYPQSMSIFFTEKFFPKHKPMISAIYTQNQDTIAKLNFTRVDTAGIATLMGTINFGIKLTQNEVYFSSMVLLNSENWLERKTNSITYYFPHKHVFSEDIGNEMERFHKEIASLFNMEQKEIRYYICDSYIEVRQLMGFDFEYNMFNMHSSGGLSDIRNGIIYSGNGSEYYPHELVHLYVPFWVGTGKINIWFKEGICTYLGGSRGYDLEWHIDVLKKYITNHNPDLSDVNKLPFMLGDSTGVEYVIGGLMCKLAFEKGGMDAVKDLLLSGDHDGSFYEGINFVLGVERKDFPMFLKNELEKY